MSKKWIGFTLLCVFFFMLFCSLGVWQIHRYHYKKTMLINYQTRSNEAKSFMQLSTFLDSLQFQKVTVDGVYVNELTMFVQNKMYKGQMGYEVLTPLRIKGQQQLLLVDRGWVQQPENKTLPKINFVNGEQHIVANIKLLNEYQFILGKNILNPLQSPLVMQKINIDEIAQATHQEFYPFVVRLDVSQENGFIRDWVIMTVEPERHLAYAVQWFALALVLLIAYFSLCRERVRKDYA